MPHESITAPHNCRWLRFKDDPQMPRRNWTEAVCVRVEWRRRMVVPALDCVGCRYFESTLDVWSRTCLPSEERAQRHPPPCRARRSLPAIARGIFLLKRQARSTR